MATDNILISKYYTRPVVRQRNSITIADWSLENSITDIPDAPDDAWIRKRVLAESIPLAPEMYTQQTLTYFAQDNVTQTNIRQFLAEDNDDPTEVSLAAQNDSIMAAFAQRYADAVVSAQQVADWRTRNDKPAPVVEPAR
jgi:hypothetical protein